MTRNGLKNKIKKWVMKQQWRFQYTSSWYSLIMSAINTGALWMIYFKDWLPIRAGILMPIITLTYLLGFLGLGWVLDTKLKLWKEASEVSVERNPFNYDQPVYREIEYNGRLSRSLWLAFYRLFKRYDIDQKEYIYELNKFIKWQDKWAKEYGIKNLCDISETNEDN